MEQPRLASIRRKISQGDSTQLQKVAEELLELGDAAPPQLMSALRERISAGAILDSWTLGKLVVRFRDAQLLRIPSVRASVRGNMESVVAMLRAGIPDSEIESWLCDRLATDFDENWDGFRQYILEALRDFGSVRCLETLQAIEYDFTGRYQTSKLLGDSMPSADCEKTLRHMQGKLDTFLGDLLREAIASVRSRDDQGHAPFLDHVGGSRGRPSFAAADEYVALAENHLEVDLGSALNNLRKATEALLKSSLKFRGVESHKGEATNTLLLPQLMGILMDRKNDWTPEPFIYKHLESLRDITTIGSHDQGRPIKELVTRQAVEGAISTFGVVRNYLERELNPPA
jgi:hypothetical protein